MPERTWDSFRSTLKAILADPTLKKAIEQQSGISSRTVKRWSEGETENPGSDPDRLVSLLQAVEAFPQSHARLLAAISQAIPDFEEALVNDMKSLAKDLPLDFWISLHRDHAHTPKSLHFTTVIHRIFSQLQSFVDPERIGVQLMVAQCSPPRTPDLSVRSLREVKKVTTYRPLTASSIEMFFLGDESLCGYGVSLSQAYVVQNTAEERHVPLRYMPDEQSAAVYPILQRGNIAGCFLVSSPQPHFFSARLLALLEVYSYFFSLAFETEQFYPPERIRLCPMPPESIQRPFIATFRDRTNALLQQDPLLSRRQGEMLAWQEIEETLLTVAVSKSQQGGSHDGNY